MLNIGKLFCHNCHYDTMIRKEVPELEFADTDLYIDCELCPVCTDILPHVEKLAVVSFGANTKTNGTSFYESLTKLSGIYFICDDCNAAIFTTNTNQCKDCNDVIDLIKKLLRDCFTQLGYAIFDIYTDIQSEYCLGIHDYTCELKKIKIVPEMSDKILQDIIKGLTKLSN